jgi:siroheme synthase
MPGEYGTVAERLLRAEVQESTPCLLVSQLSTWHQQSFRTTLRALASAPVMPAPSILIVGETVARATSQKLRALSRNYIPVARESSLPAVSPGMF